MAITQYNSSDTARMMVYLLSNAAYEHELVMQKFLVKDHFPDLRAVIDTEQYDEKLVDIGFAMADRDDTLALLKKSTIIIDSVGHFIAELLVVDLNEIWEDEVTVGLADEVEAAIVMNYFPYDDATEKEYDNDEYLSNLHVFSCSIARLIFYLIVLYVNKELDLATIAEGNPLDFHDYHNFCLEEREKSFINDDDAVLRQLKHLFIDMVAMFDKITNHCHP